MPLKASAFIAMGCNTCDKQITDNPDCTGAGNPYPCCTGAGTSTCRVLFLSGGGSDCPGSCSDSASCTSSSCSGCYKYFAWTGLSENLSCSSFDESACTESPYEEICGPSCTPSGKIFGLNGVCSGGALEDFAAAMYDPRLDTASKDITGGIVTGWSIILPWTTGPNPLAGSPSCGGGGGGAYAVKGYVKVHVIAACTGPGSGGPHGCNGYPPHGYPASNPSFCASLPPGMSHSIAIDSIECISCGDFHEVGLKPNLVQ